MVNGWPLILHKFTLLYNMMRLYNTCKMSRIFVKMSQNFEDTTKINNNFAPISGSGFMPHSLLPHLGPFINYVDKQGEGGG